MFLFFSIKHATPRVIFANQQKRKWFKICSSVRYLLFLLLLLYKLKNKHTSFCWFQRHHQHTHTQSLNQRLQIFWEKKKFFYFIIQSKRVLSLSPSVNWIVNDNITYFLFFFVWIIFSHITKNWKKWIFTVKIKT